MSFGLYAACAAAAAASGAALWQCDQLVHDAKVANEAAETRCTASDVTRLNETVARLSGRMAYYADDQNDLKKHIRELSSAREMRKENYATLTQYILEELETSMGGALKELRDDLDSIKNSHGSFENRDEFYLRFEQLTRELESINKELSATQQSINDLKSARRPASVQGGTSAKRRH
jgi:chromosome segregation ATPase